jgi:DNA polymerase III subunit delta'
MDKYPWHHEQWQQCDLALQNDRFPHGLLLTGCAGLAKFHFAQRLIKQLLCQQARACGQCKSCQLFEAGTHPDVMLVEGEGVSQQIKVDQVRDVAVFLQQTAQKAGYKIVMIRLAENMNVAASNALLKSLEEPAGKSSMILLSEHVGLLLPTITSRCQELSFVKPEKSVALSWLQGIDPQAKNEKALEFSKGAPMSARVLLESGQLDCYAQMLNGLVQCSRNTASAVSIAATWLKIDFDLVVDFLQVWSSDLMKVRMGCGGLQYESLQEAYHKYWSQVPLDSLNAFYRQLLELKSILARKISVNQQLMLEEVLLLL